MVGTTGQGATDGIRFVQFYFGLPIAMVILSLTLVPFLYRAKVYTAYEYLERRFDARTRTLTSFLFLCSRAMATGVVISAPAVILSVIFGWSLPVAVAIIGLPTVVYTMFGGVQAVAWADVKQMVLIVFGLLAIVVALILDFPTDVGVGDAMRIAGSTGRLNALDFRFDPRETYTFWSGVIGGTFLMMSYFGTDQSQVQRHLTARSDDEARSSLLMSAYWKIPLQALVLMVGVLVFVYYLFTQPPLLFNPAQGERVRDSEPDAYGQLVTRYDDAFARRRTAALAVGQARSAGDDAAMRQALADFTQRTAQVETVRDEALTLAGEVTGDNTRDVNYIIPTFVLNELPIGLPGIFIAAVLAAAMSSIAAELNALSTATIIDFYKRRIRTEAPDSHYLRVSKITTGFWGIFACVVAIYAATLGSLIEVVNRFGSFFYGSILGVFLLGMIGRSRGRGAFWGLLAGMGTVALVQFGNTLLDRIEATGVHFGAPMHDVFAYLASISFLWHNVIGACTVLIVGMLLSLTVPAAPEQAA
jgi:Na+/proline symporter